MPTNTAKAQLAAPDPVRVRALRAAKPQPPRAATQPRATKPTRPRAAAKPQPLVLSVLDIIGGKGGDDLIVPASVCQKVYNRVHRAFKKKQPVEVSFRGTSRVVLPFMHFAIGKLYEKYPAKEIDALVKCTDLDSSSALSLKIAIRSCKRYFEIPGHAERMKQVIKESRHESWY